MTPEQSELKALGFEIPDSITPAVAYRSWRFIDGKLCSHNGTPWTPGTAMKATCLYNDCRGIHGMLLASSSGQSPSDCPLENCTCGLYSAKREEASHIVPCGSLYVHGEVYIWGKIFEGPFGFRSEYAYPKQFFATSEKQKLILEAMEFGVPVVLVEGVVPNQFPFPTGGRVMTTKNRVYRQVDRFYAAPILPGLPALAVGVWDSLTQDLSQAYLQVLVAILFLFGLAASLLSLYSRHLRRKLRRMTANNHHKKWSEVRK